jgi:hypothetical protein
MCGASGSAVHNPDDFQEITILSEATDMKLRSIIPIEIKIRMNNIAMDAEAKRLLPYLKRKRRKPRKMSPVPHDQYIIRK